MAATGYTPIYLYYSSTTSNAPAAGNLGYGELAINITDKNLFFKDNTNAVNTVPIRQSSGSSDGWLSSANWTTFNSKQAALVSGTNIKTVSGTSLLGSGDLGTIGTGYGGTGLTSFTANGIVYASSTSALATSSGLTYNGTQLATTGTFSYNTSIGEGAATTLSSAGTNIRLAPSATWTITSIYAGGSEQLRVANSGDCTVYNGNLVIGTSGKGIDFSATAGTGTSELLADYEEGTWTPTVATGINSPTYATQAGRYTKIGNTVVIHCYLSVNGGTTNGGALTIGGLPYANVTFDGSGGAFSYVGGGMAQSLATSALPTVQVSTTAVYFYKTTSAGFVGTDLSSSTFRVDFTCTYSV